MSLSTAEFKKYLDQCKNSLPAILDFERIPDEVSAGHTIEKLVVVVKNAKGDVLSDFSESLKITLEITNTTVLLSLSNSK